MSTYKMPQIQRGDTGTAVAMLQGIMAYRKNGKTGMHFRQSSEGVKCGYASEPEPLRYSLAPDPIPQISAGAVRYHGDSDFAKAIYGKDPDTMWAVMDELMTALQVVNPRLYDSVMRKIAE